MERNIAMARKWLSHMDRSSRRRFRPSVIPTRRMLTTIIGHHNITKDAQHWLTSPKRKELFGPLGVTNIRTFVDPQNSTRVAVLMDVPDINAFATAMQSKAAADAMAFDGVVPESLVILVES
jgi:hypothetical protein